MRNSGAASWSPPREEHWRADNRSMDIQSMQSLLWDSLKFAPSFPHTDIHQTPGFDREPIDACIKGHQSNKCARKAHKMFTPDQYLRLRICRDPLAIGNSNPPKKHKTKTVNKQSTRCNKSKHPINSRSIHHPTSNHFSISHTETHKTASVMTSPTAFFLPCSKWLYFFIFLHPRCATRNDSAKVPLH